MKPNKSPISGCCGNEGRCGNRGREKKKKGEKKIFKPESVGNHWHESGEGTREKKKKKKEKKYIEI